jgi:hypothetical protein
VTGEAVRGEAVTEEAVREEAVTEDAVGVVKVVEARAAGMIAGVMEAAREGVTAAEATVVVVTAGRHTLRTLS